MSTPGRLLRAQEVLELPRRRLDRVLRAIEGARDALGEFLPSLLALAGSALITAGIALILGRGAGLIVAGLFLLCVVGWRPLAALAINGLATVMERDDA